MIGLPRRQATAGLLGVVPVHCSDRVAGLGEDRLQLQDVGPVRAHVELPVEVQVSGRGDGSTSVKAKQDVAYLDGVAVCDLEAGNAAGCG